ncbi:MAG: FHA domain-containing protein [Acidobacteriota bacterium]
MTTLALEIHDAALLAVSEAGAPPVSSPGFALYDGGHLVTGRDALRRAREKPRFIHHRFWQDLNNEPLGRPFPHGLSAADLAHAQLSQIWQEARDSAGDGAIDTAPDSLLLVVPGAFDASRLGLLLGIARAAGLPVDGLVDRAVAATVAAGAGGGPRHKVLHLDLHLHRIVLTELETTDAPAIAETLSRRVIRRGVQTDESFGGLAIQDAWAKRVAELFVHSTRFDPLYSAAAEQDLYDRLPLWLDALGSKEVIDLELGPSGRERTVELTRPDVVDAADAFYDHLRDLVLSSKHAGEEATLLLAPAAAELPGLEPRLAGLRGVTTVAQPPGTAAAGALAAHDEIRAAGDLNTEREGGSQASGGAQALPFVTRLSYEAQTSTGRAPTAGMAASSVQRSSASLPSHVLHEGLAYPITEVPFVLGLEIGQQRGLELSGQTAGISRTHCHIVRRAGEVWIEDLSTYGTFVNDERVAERAVLFPGDRLRLGTPGIEMQLIAVLPAEGSHGAP